MERWYCVHTKPREESVAETHLRRQDFTVYLPRLCEQRHRGGRWRQTIKPLFPRYLFVQMDISSQNASVIRSTRGVVGLVRIGDGLPAVPDAIVETIKQGEDGRMCGKGAPDFRPGQPVQVIEGPLAGVHAIFRASSGEERAMLFLDLLGRSNMVTFPLHQLAPL